jgi:hypothetical protein
MRCDFLGPDSSLWSRFLADSPHDFYHLPKYVALSTRDRLSAPDADGDPLAFHAEDDEGHRFLATLVVRPLPKTCESATPLFDAITPYGYACPLVINKGNVPIEPFLDEAIAQLKYGLRSQGIISAFFRSHPTIPLPIESLSKSGCLVQHCHTVSIDLTLDQKELWHQTRQDHRSGINKAKRNGFTVEIQPDWKDFDGFFQAYTETMHRVGASELYFFSREYFAELRESIGDVLHLAVCHKDGAVACAGIFAEVCGIVQYHLSGTIEEYRSQFPTKIMLDSVRTWAKERGNHSMHLGGGYGGSEDSLFLFKAGFSHLRCPFYTWRLIADSEEYQRQCQKWESRTGKAASPSDGFFPAYRAP